MSLTCIVPMTDSPVVARAASELSRYLGLGLGDPPLPVRTAQDSGTGIVRLGLAEDSDTAQPNATGSAISTDDAYSIRMGPDGGTITGANERSVLLGVYRYLTELGFRWVRPGRTGEVVPDLNAPLPDVNVDDAASYRHRGVCIEGAVSRENVLDMVDWLPKLGFNGYFIQFREAYNFYQRWYEHSGNPTLPSEAFSLQRARELTAELRDEITARGLDLHMVGHGWTCEPFGIPGTGWYTHEGPIPGSARPYLAEVKGARDLWGGIALNTNLCYGNPETRRIITDAILEWAQANRDVDIIHFWLADGSNNHCECPLCADRRPADLYVDMLNDVDRKLTAAGLSTRIVFLVYVDLLWPPVRERLENPDRFILMFAPITRSYSRAFAPADPDNTPELPPYTRNRLAFPKDPARNVAFLQAWQKQFAGDSFDFDYHFMWDHHKDPGQMALAEVLHQDCARLKELNLNGFMSCQNQRAFFPTGLGMTVMGRTLWNRDLPFDEIVNDYFADAFGEGADQAADYLRDLSELFDPVFIRGERNAEEKTAMRGKLEQALKRIHDMRPTLRRRATTATNPCHTESWNILEAHADLAERLAKALDATAAGETDRARELGMDLFAWVRAKEPRLQHVFDAFEFQITLAPLFGIPRSEIQ